MSLHCAPCTDLCCTSWFDLLNELVEAVHTSITECSATNCCGGWARFVSHAEPHLATADYVAGWLADVAVQASGTTANRFMRPRLALNVKIHESGWPSLSAPLEGNIIEPDAEAYHYAAMHSTAHAQAGFLAGLAWATQTCSNIKGITPLRPLPPSGGGVAWVFGFLLEV